MKKLILQRTLVLILYLLPVLSGYSQIASKTITVKGETLTVMEVCQLLQKQYGIKVAYSNSDEQLRKKIILPAGSYRLQQLLELSFKKAAIRYQLTNHQLIIMAAAPVSSVAASLTKTSVTISGFIEDAETGEKLPGATLYLPQINRGTVTNNYGFYTITAPQSITSLLVTYTGYEAWQQTPAIAADEQLTIQLKPKRELEAVVIKTGGPPPVEQSTQMSKISLPVSIVKSMPRFLGETDVLKTLQLLPGVSQGAEGSSGILVRGGTPDQNLILLDGTPVYNASHLFGIFSTFNSNALKSVELYKGGFPARFGSRLSSVVDIVTKDGNMKGLHGEGSIGLLASNFTLEGPLQKDKTSFVIAGRRTYMDLLAAPFLKRQSGGDIRTRAYFYDINAKLHHVVSAKDRLFLSFYNGNDYFKTRTLTSEGGNQSSENMKLGWGNTMATFRWNHVYSPRLFSNTLVNYTHYRFLTTLDEAGKTGTMSTEYTSTYFSGINDIGGRIDFDYRPLPEHSIKFGTAAQQHSFKPGASTIHSAVNNQPEVSAGFSNGNQKSMEFSAYGEDDWQLSDKLKINAGLHASAFKAATKWYTSLQPRFSLRYLLPHDIALKASYTHMNQYIHLLANNSVSLPTDLWVPSTDKVKPTLSRQVALGLAKTLRNGRFDISLEGYYKTMDGIIEYQEGSSYLNSSVADWDTKVEAGKGRAYGAELLLQKLTGKTKGWIGYTYSRSNRVFPAINFGRRFDYKYDRRHDFEMVVTYAINKAWEVSASWEFQTGAPFTIPVAQYEGINNASPYSNTPVTIDYIKGRNGFRLLSYHRLDAGITWKKQKKQLERSWNFSLYNAYNRKNPFYYTLDQYTGSGTAQLKATSLLPVLPSISYGIKF